MTRTYELVKMFDSWYAAVEDVAPKKEPGIAPAWPSGFDYFEYCERKDGRRVIATTNSKITSVPRLILPDGMLTMDHVNSAIEIAQAARNMPYYGDTEEDLDILISKEFLERALADLQKGCTPVAVELEVDEHTWTENGRGENQKFMREERIRVREGNFIIPVRVHYRP